MNNKLKTSIYKIINNYSSFNLKKFNYNLNLSSYLYNKKNLNLLLIYKLIIIAKNIIDLIITKNGKILIVDFNEFNINKQKLHNIILNSNNFYLDYKWFGGLLTNWINFKEKIKKINFLENNLKQISVNDSQKKVNKLKKKINLFNKLFFGIKNMIELPNLVIFINFKENFIGIQECKKLGIPLICLGDIDLKIEKIDYPILCNIENSYFIVYYLLNKLIIK